MHAPERVVLPTSVVARPALFDRLTAGMARGIVLVSAPAGSGKTLLLRSWVDTAGLAPRTAWVSVERDERDGPRFWMSVVEGLRGAGVAGPLSDVIAAPGFDGDAVVDRIVAATAGLQEPVLLVIDDLHQLLDRTAMAQLERLLAHRPDPLRVVLAARHDPPLGLHRHRLAQELAELRAADLRFGPDEARALLTTAGVTLGEGGLTSLLARTEGWVAGLRLAALSMTGRSDPDRFVAEFSGSDRTIADYLVAEVLRREAEPVRRLLLRTSILERVHGSLADRLVGGSGSERMLLELEDAGAFVFSIDPERTWFRYHHLFVDLLRLELRRTEPDTVPELHRLAAGWLAGRGLAIDAIRHAQAAGDWQLAGALLAEHGFSLALDGSFATLRSLLASFPQDAFDDPELAAFLAYGEVIRPSLDRAAAYIAIAERGAPGVSAARRPMFEAMLATARLTLARWRGDPGSLIEQVRPLLDAPHGATVRAIAISNDVRAVALMNLGAVELWAGSGDDAEHHLRQGLELALQNGRPYVEMGCLGHLALAAGRRSVSGMRGYASETITVMERHGWQTEPIAPLVFAAMGAADCLQARFDEADPWLARAESVLRDDAEPAKALCVRYARGLQRLGQGALDAATELFAETQRIQAFMVAPDPLAISARGLQAQAMARLGELAGARAVLSRATDAERVFGDARVAVAAVRLAEGDAAGALEDLGPVLDGSWPGVVPDLTHINAHLVSALARERLGDARRAEDDIEHALDLAEPEALLLPFLVTRAEPLLERHPGHRTQHAALLSVILDVLAGSSPPGRAGESPVLQEALTESELRVLRYLPSNLTAPEIASEVFLSTSTVKTHMRHVYEKLGAHKRAEAVDRARQLGLLAPATRSRR